MRAGAITPIDFSNSFNSVLFGKYVFNCLKESLNLFNSFLYLSYCILLTTEPTNSRLLAIEKTLDGFLVAEADLKLRGPGDYLGENQSGYFSLNYSDFSNDIKIYECAKADAIEMLPIFKKKELESSIFNDIIKNEVINRNRNN